MLFKRAQLAAGGDPRECGFPLGVMMTRRVITRSERDAGLTYARLRSAAFGRPWPSATAIGREEGTVGLIRLPRFERDEVRVWQRYRAAKAALLSRGPAVSKATEAVAVFEEYQAALEEPARTLAADGLKTLVQHFRKGWP